MKEFVIGGVPEHFNLPWHFAIEKNHFKDEGFLMKWKDFHGGTGAMTKALREKEIDMAVILTEGITKDIIAGNDCKIVQIYVETPLIWGVHVAQNSELQNEEEIASKKIAVSRMGSGSHLMAYVLAQSKGLDTSSLQFEIVGNLDGAVKALSGGEADYFMWEYFTTKPLVDSGVFRRVGEFPTPWPCFVIAVRNDVLKEHGESVKKMLNRVNETTQSIKSMPDIAKVMSERYKQKLEDIELWLSKTKWGQQNITPQIIENVQKRLMDLNLINKQVPYDQLVHCL